MTKSKRKLIISQYLKVLQKVAFSLVTSGEYSDTPGGLVYMAMVLLDSQIEEDIENDKARTKKAAKKRAKRVG